MVYRFGVFSFDDHAMLLRRADQRDADKATALTVSDPDLVVRTRKVA